MRTYVEEEVEEDIVLASIVSAKLGVIYSLFRNPVREQITMMVSDDSDEDYEPGTFAHFGRTDEFE